MLLVPHSGFVSEADCLEMPIILDCEVYCTSSDITEFTFFFNCSVVTCNHCALTLQSCVFRLLLIVWKMHINSPVFRLLLDPKSPHLHLFFFLLQLAKNVGNTSFNDIMEGNLPSPSPKPSPSSDM